MTTLTPSQLPPVTPPMARDPLAAVLDLGWQASRVGLVVGLMVALFGHSMAFIKPMTALHDMFEGVQAMRSELSEFYWATYDIEVEEPAKDEEPAKEEDVAPPEPDPVEPEVTEPDPIVPPPPADDTAEETPPESDDPYEEPPPAAAEAADVITADEEAVDLTGEGWDMVDKDGSKETGGGMTAKEGTAKEPVYDPRAKATGTPGGTGTASVVRPRPPAPKQNLSRQAMPTNMGVLRACPFPPQADVAQVDRATVIVSVTVTAAGRAVGASAQGDPGYGFGAAARRCAMSTSYKPALNASGKAVQSRVALRFRFTR